MRKIRDTHQLYLILWGEIKDLKIIQGLCCEIFQLHVKGLFSIEESNFLKRHLKSNKPRLGRHTKFYEHEYFIKGNSSAFWWNIEELTNPVNRKAFIREMIELTKPTNEDEKGKYII